MKPVVAVDIDEVLAPTMKYMVEFHNSNYETRLSVEDFFSYDFWEVWGGTREESIEKYMAFADTEDFANMDPEPGAQDALNALKEHYDLVVVTSRQHELEQITRAWIDEKFPGIFSRVMLGNIYAQSGISTTKPDMCQQVGAEVLLDDSVKYALECAQAGIKTLLFGRYPWNKDEHLPENVVRVGGWREVLGILLPNGSPEAV